MKRWMVGPGLGLVALLALGPSGVSAKSLQPVDVTVFVDTSACATGAIQCLEQTDHTAEAAGPTNHNPVRLIVQVVSGGAAVTGLRSRDFHIATVAVPAYAGALEKLKCESCFRSSDDTGVYQLWVHPQENWKSGTYGVQLQIDVGGDTMRTLSTIEIPFE